MLTPFTLLFSDTIQQANPTSPLRAMDVRGFFFFFFFLSCQCVFQAAELCDCLPLTHDSRKIELPIPSPPLYVPQVSETICPQPPRLVTPVAGVASAPFRWLDTGVSVVAGRVSSHRIARALLPPTSCTSPLSPVAREYQVARPAALRETLYSSDDLSAS